MIFNSIGTWITTNLKYLGYAIETDLNELKNGVKDLGYFPNFKNWLRIFGAITFFIVLAGYFAYKHRRKIKKYVINFFQ